VTGSFDAGSMGGDACDLLKADRFGPESVKDAESRLAGLSKNLSVS
jgi:hypothetical protein